MLTYKECLAWSGLKDDEVAAIAVQEDLPRIAALELESYLRVRGDGEVCLSSRVVEAIERARAAGDVVQATKLRLVLGHFCVSHPRAGGAA